MTPRRRCNPRSIPQEAGVDSPASGASARRRGALEGVLLQRAPSTTPCTSTGENGIRNYLACSVRKSPTNIFLVTHSLKMARIHTRGGFTHMVNFRLGRDWACDQLI